MSLCDHPELLPLDEALERLRAALPARVGGAVVADRDDPATDRSAMDGAAVRSADGLAPRVVAGTLFAGDDPSDFEVGPGTAVKVMTGACIPSGADAVVPVELLRPEGEFLVPLEAPAPGDHIRRRGSHGRAGDLWLPEGLPLSAPRAGLRAWVGAAPELPRRPRVGVASTGDELSGDPLPHQIRDSNGPMLRALVHRLGAEPVALPALPDEPGALRRALSGLGDLDLLLTTGGVSMGEKDLLPEVLAELGAELLFHKIRLKPGKPMLAALLGPTLVLGLPGNPVSAYLNALIFLPVALARIQGWAEPDPWRRGELAEPVRNPGGRPSLVPCRREGELLKPLPFAGSGHLAALAQAEACAWIPEGGAEAGPVRFIELL